MKKRIISILAVCCMMVAMMPAAFAAEGTPRPEPEYLVVSEDDIPMAPMSISETQPAGTGTQNDPFLIYDEGDFSSLMDLLATYRGETYVRLMDDIDLSLIDKSVAQWDGYLKYFRGEFDGNGYTISNLPTDRFLIYGWVGGTIKDLTLDLNGNAGTLVYCPVSLSSGGSILQLPTTLCGIDVISAEPIVLEDANGQANYAPFIYSSGPYFTMESCRNYADISGSTYASVFYGYYPLANLLPADHYIKFIDCQNHGDITYQYAGLIFGNPTGLFYKNYTLDGIKNYGELRGTETVHFFSSDANSIDAIPSYATPGSFLYEQEARLPESEVNDICTDPACPKHGNATDYTGGKKYVGDPLEDFKVELDGNDFKVTTSPGVTNYIATIFCYVSEFVKEGDSLTYYGTNRMTINQEITTSDGTFIIPNFKDYPVTDGPLPTGSIPQFTPVNGLYFINNGTNSCYWWNNNTSSENSMLLPDHVWYLNGNMTPGSTQWQVYVSAFDAEGHLIDTAVLARNGVNG